METEQQGQRSILQSKLMEMFQDVSSNDKDQFVFGPEDYQRASQHRLHQHVQCVRCSHNMSPAVVQLVCVTPSGSALCRSFIQQAFFTSAGLLHCMLLTPTCRIMKPPTCTERL